MFDKCIQKCHITVSIFQEFCKMCQNDDADLRAGEFTKSSKEKGDSKRLPTLADSVASLRAEVLY